MTANKIGADGQSVLPHGIFDMSDPSKLGALAEEAEAKLKEILGTQLDQQQIRAKYKLEVNFTKRHRHLPYKGILTAFMNGGFAHGGGDEAVYFCGREEGDNRYCTGVIQLMFIDRRVALCPKCKKHRRPQDLAGQVMYNLTTQGWTQVLLRAYRALEHSADITIGHLPDDVIKVAQEAQVKQSAGDKVLKLRGERRFVIYTQKRILEDLAAGSSLEARFRAFLMA